MRYLLFLLPFIFVFCKNENPENQLIITYEHALREKPGEKNREIRLLPKDEKVTNLDEVSTFETPWLLGDTLLSAPWLKVETADKEQGWLYTLYAKPASGDFEKWLLDKRLKCYFGKNLAAQYFQFVATEPQNTEADFAAHYRESVALRDTFMHILARRADPNEANAQPDFLWLRTLLPGFILQKVAEGTQLHLFADYQYFQPIALKTSGLQDDAFIETCLLAFSADSIESFFPAWKFQYADYEAASQLGTGIHLKMFRQIDKAMQTGTLFQPELRAFKEAVLEDIIGKNVVYWQSKELILKELDQILKTGFKCLDDRDRAVLQSRLVMFEDPEANGLRVNLRSGI